MQLINFRLITGSNISNKSRPQLRWTLIQRQTLRYRSNQQKILEIECSWKQQIENLDDKIATSNIFWLQMLSFRIQWQNIKNLKVRQQGLIFIFHTNKMIIFPPSFTDNAQLWKINSMCPSQSRQLTPSHKSRTIQVRRSQTAHGLKSMYKQLHQTFPLTLTRPQLSVEFSQFQQPMRNPIFNKFSHNFYSTKLKTMELCNKTDNQPIHSRKSSKFGSLQFNKQRSKSNSQYLRHKSPRMPIKSAIIAKTCKIMSQSTFSEQISKQIINKPRISFRSISHMRSQIKNKGNEKSEYRPWSPKKGESYYEELSYY